MAAPASPSPREERRCERHGLWLGADDRCVRCRREASTSGARVAWILAALCSAGAAAFAIGGRPRASAPAVAIDTPPHADAPPIVARPATAVPPTPMIAPRPVVAAPSRVAAAEPPPRVVVDDTAARQATDEAYVAAARARRATEEQQRAQSAVRVSLYSTSWCPACRAAREWLGRQGIAYVDHDVESDSAAHDRLAVLNPRRSIPVFEIDDQVLVGFSAARVTSAIAQAAERRASR